jgi:hypothetical protein
MEHVENVEQEDVPNGQETVVIKPTIKPPKVLFEILMLGKHYKGENPQDSECYKMALEYQKQIDALRGNDCFKVRILWKSIEVERGEIITEEVREENEKWLIDNSECRFYYVDDWASSQPQDLWKQVNQDLWKKDFIKTKFNPIKAFVNSHQKMIGHNIKMSNNK